MGARCAVISDANVVPRYGCIVEASLRDAGFELSAFKPSYSYDAKQNHIFNVLTGVFSVTLVRLQNHCIKELNLVGGTFYKKDIPNNDAK